MNTNVGNIKAAWAQWGLKDLLKFSNYEIYNKIQGWGWWKGVQKQYQKRKKIQNFIYITIATI